MTHDLLHGDLWAAVHDNVFLLAAVPTLAAFLLVRRARGRRALPAAAVPAVGGATPGGAGAGSFSHPTPPAEREG